MLPRNVILNPSESSWIPERGRWRRQDEHHEEVPGRLGRGPATRGGQGSGVSSSTGQLAESLSLSLSPKPQITKLNLTYIFLKYLLLTSLLNTLKVLQEKGPIEPGTNQSIPIKEQTS